MIEAEVSEMIFDTHAHYDDEKFDEDRDALLNGMAKHGIIRIVNVGASLQGARDTSELMKKYDFVYGAIGIHPDHAGELKPAVMMELKEMLQHEKAVAVGEIGLDYYWDKESHELQKYWFRKQMELALELKLPIAVHSREAAQDTFDMVKQFHAGKPGFAGGVIHCYSGSVEMAKEYIKLGYYIGVGGVITFKNARVLKEVAAAIPMERLVIETDCPYLAPTPFRGKRNSSLYLPYVVEEIAKIKKMTTEEVEQATYENACQSYQLK